MPRRAPARWSPLSLATALFGIAAPAAGAPPDCTGVAPIAHTGLESVTIAEGLAGRPLFAVSPPGDALRLFIVEQDGFIRIHHRGDPPSVTTLFLDLSAKVTTGGNEQGLLGLAFGPDFADQGRFYVYYTEDAPPFGSNSVVARYAVGGDPDVADPASEERILVFAQPDFFGANHNGGQLLFDEAGFLYVFTGDGGGANDQHGSCGNGQNRSTLLGKALRIDVAGVDPSAGAPDCDPDGLYGVPADNPLADGPGGACDEIFLLGLRNPWRDEIDPLTGDLYVADVGQNCWEEIDYLESSSAPGANLGWRQMEGTHCFDPGNPGNCDPLPVPCPGSPDCGSPALVQPVLEYDHTGGACSVTGGIVYRGCRLPGLTGRYFFGDFCAGFVRSIVVNGGVATDEQDHSAELDPNGLLANALTSFGRNGRGELHIVDRGGRVLKVLPLFTDLIVSGPGAADPFLLGTDWSWENTAFETEHPVAEYRVYRGLPNGLFTCVHASPTPGWPGGDPIDPAPGELFAYIVTAVAPDARETSPGEPAGARTLAPDPCPP